MLENLLNTISGQHRYIAYTVPLSLAGLSVDLTATTGICWISYQVIIKDIFQMWQPLSSQQLL